MRMTRLVVSFNRHFFFIAIAACFVGIVLMVLIDLFWLRVVLGIGVATAVYFMAASLIASYFVYDASDLYRLQYWPDRCLPRDPGDALLVHAGFDPASQLIRQRYPSLHLRVFDFFDDSTTTEASIQRAHRLNPPSPDSQKIAADHWPAEAASQDVIFSLSAAHELRKPSERTAFFNEARRVLRPGGKVIVIEQLRDGWNFACFGVAAFHFLSRRTWMRAFKGSNFAVRDEFAITPFMRAFVLQAPRAQAAPSIPIEGADS